MARPGFFSRIVSAIRRAFSTREEESGRATPTGGGAPPKDRDRQRRRETDPYLQSWRALSNRPGYLDHRDFFTEKIVAGRDLDYDDQLQLWQEYITYMTRSNNAYRLNTLNNPFWRISGMHPDNFDWWGWRDAMGYQHGNRKG